MDNSTVIKRSEVGFGIEVSDIFKFFTTIIIVAVMADLITRFIRPTNAIASQYIQYQPQTYATQAYFGMIDSRVLIATYETDWIDLLHDPPYTPWITADFFNDGPDTVYIAINHPSVYSELHIGESFKVDFTGAERRIEVIFYKTNLGERASVRVIGKY